MTAKESVNEGLDLFREDWLACLRAHYLYTLRAGDLNNAEGLRRVLIEAGISEPEIDALRLDAGFAPVNQIAEVEPSQTDEAPAVQDFPVASPPPAPDPIPDPIESAELPEIVPPTPAPPAIARDLFSWKPAEDTPPAASLPMIEPVPPPQTDKRPLKPKPKAPKQQSLF